MVELRVSNGKLTSASIPDLGVMFLGKDSFPSSSLERVVNRKGNVDLKELCKVISTILHIHSIRQKRSNCSDMTVPFF